MNVWFYNWGDWSADNVHSVYGSQLLMPSGTVHQAFSNQQQGLRGCWNALLEETTSAPSLMIFCQHLIALLFRRSYHELIIW